ncbi:excalibur calcium-binding domain-containing protein [Amnibacterium endophyticum]|uniref:Excalibur calcium-binding domain-containing protein n=1 Tax=Amnibacterium endophyticum TaxID=2109337 RepID=A0ABW4LGC6_9MICO
MPRPRSLVVAVALAAGMTLAPAFPATAAPAHASAKVYANCTAIHRVYSGGIAKEGVKWNRTTHGKRALKGHVKFSTALYLANRRSDRDKDGIACEKS